ncbi:unnamed protein product, partial [Ectocarpus sp. 13 AM-2016]
PASFLLLFFGTISSAFLLVLPLETQQPSHSFWPLVPSSDGGPIVPPRTKHTNNKDTHTLHARIVSTSWVEVIEREATGDMRARKAVQIRHVGRRKIQAHLRATAQKHELHAKTTAPTLSPLTFVISSAG